MRTAFTEFFAADGEPRDQDNILDLTQDYLFDSPSTAAGVLLGRSANGRIEWKNQLGQTLKSIQEIAEAG